VAPFSGDRIAPRSLRHHQGYSQQSREDRPKFRDWCGYTFDRHLGTFDGFGLKGLDIHTIADLRRLELSALESRFGRYGVRLYELARGIDENLVVPDRPTQSISAEDTFERDVPLTETEPMIRRLAELTWAASRKETRVARTVVLKLKTAEFKILTRSHTPSSPPSSCEELTTIALSLRERVSMGPQQRFRLVGVGLSNFFEPEDLSAQPGLFGRRWDTVTP
jgi:DNA polymerase-4